MIVGFKSIQDQGKTLSAVATVVELILHHGYDPEECYGNVAINLKGFHYLSSQGMRDLLGRMVREKWRHKVLVIDEINRVYPARFWKDADRTMELLTIWQDEKMFHWIVYTCHVGNSVDLLVRDATQVIAVPRFDKLRDVVRLGIVNSLDLECHDLEIPRASRFFPLYDRWAVVD